MCNEQRREQKCQEPLSLDVGSRKAFADRQAKLVKDSKWPLARWYTDEDFCRAYNTAVQLQAEIERLQTLVKEQRRTNTDQHDDLKRLQAIVAKLPAWASRIEEANEGLLTVFTSDWRAVLTTVAREMEAAQAAKGGE